MSSTGEMAQTTIGPREGGWGMHTQPATGHGKGGQAWAKDTKSRASSAHTKVELQLIGAMWESF